MIPLIGITCSYDIPSRQIRLNTNYINAILKAGGLPFPLPITPIDSIPLLLSYFDGILLSGGGDIFPALYGRTNDTRLLHNLNILRDYYELALFREANRIRMPVLGICRGMQIINVYCRGTLFLDLTRELSGNWAHRSHLPDQSAVHPVIFTKGSLLYEIFGSLAWTDSSHHQAIRKVGRGLTATACSPDGVVEAVEGKSDSWTVGVQWHPEKNQNHSGAALFAQFVQKAREYTANKPP